MAQEYLEKLSVFIEKAAPIYAQKYSFECRHFFSGAALYVDRRICITLTPGGLAVKLPQATRESLFQNRLAIPLRYFAQGPVKKEYALFAQGIENADETLADYVKEGINYVLSLPKPKINKKRIAKP